MSNQGLLAAGLTGLLVAGAGAGAVLHLCDPREPEAQAGKQIWGSSVWDYPPDATVEQRLALTNHITEGALMPAGFRCIDDITGVLTGAVDPATGEREIRVEVTTASAEIDAARLYVAGALQDTATRADGGIADRPAEGMSVATLTAWIPPSSRSWSAEVQWDGPSGVRTGGGTISRNVPWFRELLARTFSR